ncbi:MAG: lipase family protein [Pirellulales bacterium]
MGGIGHSLISLLDTGAESTIYSSLAGPIESLRFLRRSLLFAELSNLSYLSRAEAGQLAYQIGFPEIRFYDRDGAQAYIFANDDDAVVTCRGTEPHDWNDVRADLDLGKALAETVGWVHRGFKREVDDLWPRLEQALVNNTRTLWFTGHSLGGAMAAICAGRCKLSYIRSNPRALFTYGSPRVGNRRYVNYVQLEAYRWVNNNDIVARVPPAWLGFRHKGQELYLNAYGKIRRQTGWQRVKDRWRGFIRGLREGRFDHFADHAIGQYLDHIRAAVQEEEERLAIPLPPWHTTHDLPLRRAVA